MDNTTTSEIKTVRADAFLEGQASTTGHQHTTTRLTTTLFLLQQMQMILDLLKQTEQFEGHG